MEQSKDNKENSRLIKIVPDKDWINLASEKNIVSRLLRPDIARSWERCLASNVNSLAIPKITTTLDIHDVLEQCENERLLEIARPYMDPNMPAYHI